jgi:hypothetical protein
LDQIDADAGIIGIAVARGPIRAPEAILFPSVRASVGISADDHRSMNGMYRILATSQVTVK